MKPFCILRPVIAPQATVNQIGWSLQQRIGGSKKTGCQCIPEIKTMWCTWGWVTFAILASKKSVSRRCTAMPHLWAFSRLEPTNRSSRIASLSLLWVWGCWRWLEAWRAPRGENLTTRGIACTNRSVTFCGYSQSWLRVGVAARAVWLTRFWCGRCLWSDAILKCTA